MTTRARPEPNSLLARHRLLAPTAGVLVSPLCLGAMNFGDAWKAFMGECSKDTAFEMMDFFYSQGGNFIDTASAYQNEESEMWIGEWLASRGKRAEMVIATKYTSNFRSHMGDSIIHSNFGGNSTKSLYVSVETSLKKLQTDYIDLLYVHFFDMSTSIPELMQSLNHLVTQRKVFWVVVQANCYAREHGLRQFSVYQGRWSAAERDFEREIIPMCKSEGMALAPWGVLGGGYFKSPDEGEKQDGRTLNVKTGKEASVSVVLDRVGKKHVVPITSIALAYVMHKAPYVFPIVGGRKVSHLKGNIEALGIRLSQEDIALIELGYDFDVGFPHNFLSVTKQAPQGPEDMVFTKRQGHFDYVKGPQPILPPQSS